MDMKKYLFSIVLAAMALAGCVSQQGQVERKRFVQEAVANRHWRIDVTSMNTMRYGARTVTPDFYLELRGDTLRSYLPYLGQVHQAPMLSPSQGLNFDAPVLSYRLSNRKAHISQIEMDVRSQEDSYRFRVDIYDSGQAYIQVQSMHRDPISFDGSLEE